MPRPDPFRSSCPRAVVFDLDGTLIDTAPDLHAALVAVLAAAGRSGVTIDDVRHMVGDGARALVERGFAATGDPLPPAAVEGAVARFLGHYGAHIADLSRPFPGVDEALTTLSAAGARLGVCTNKPERLSRDLLAATGLAGRFAAVVGGDSLDVRKPDAGHLLGTLARMGAEPAGAVMVGDSANDVAAARAAGLPVVLVSFGYTATPARELGADAVIDGFADLPEALAGLA